GIASWRCIDENRQVVAVEQRVTEIKPAYSEVKHANIFRPRAHVESLQDLTTERIVTKKNISDARHQYTHFRHQSFPRSHVATKVQPLRQKKRNDGPAGATFRDPGPDRHRALEPDALGLRSLPRSTRSPRFYPSTPHRKRHPAIEVSATRDRLA